MSNKNIANNDTFDQLLANNLIIQSTGVGLEIYSNGATVPAYSFDPYNLQCNIQGKLNVFGEASFTSLAVSEIEGGIINLGNANNADLIDLGLNCEYNDGAKKYTGIVRDSSDGLKRWTFYQNIPTLPTTRIQTISQSTVASARMNQLYINDGTAASPGIIFDQDTNKNTGLYRIGANSIGITANGILTASFTRPSSYSATFALSLDTTLKTQKLDTIDDSQLSNNVLTGSMYIASTTGNDKWFKFYSNTTASVASYAGIAFTSPQTHYFTSNVGSSLQIFGRANNNDLVTTAPDYRIQNTKILSINLTTIESKMPFIIPVGSLTNLSVQFNSEQSTGLYKSAVNSIGLVCSNLNILNISSTGITASQNLFNLDGTATAPSVSFTNSPTTGIYSSTVNVLNFSANSLNRLTISQTTATFTTESVVNIGTQGSGSTLNVFGLITGANGINITSGVSSFQAIVIAGLITASSGILITTGQSLNIGTQGTTSNLNVLGLITATNGLQITGNTQLQTLSTSGLIQSQSITMQTGQTLNIGTQGTGTPANIYGLITGTNGLLISAGLTNLQSLTTQGLIQANLGMTILTGQTLSIGTSGTTSPLLVYGQISGTNGISITAGSTTLQALTTQGLLQTQSITVQTGQTLSVGTSGTTSPFLAYGLITGTNGISITAGQTTLQALTTQGLIQANLGLTILTGQTLSVGTSGTTSPLQVYGQISGTNGISITAGLTTLQALTTQGLIQASAGITIQSGQTLNVGIAGAVSSANVYGTIYGTSTLSILGASTLQAVTASGQIIGQAGLQITSGSSIMQAVQAQGLIQAQSITMQSGQTFNCGTSGTTSTANIYGLITGYNGLQITNGATNIQAITAAGLITGGAGLTITAGLTTTQALTTQGLIQANLGLTILTGQTLSVGTSGTTSPLLVYGQISGTNGISITAGSTTLQALTTQGLLQSQSITMQTGQTLSVGTTGTTSPLTVYGLITGANGLTIQGATNLITLKTTGLIQATAGITIQTGQSLLIGTTGTTSPLTAYGLITGLNGITITGTSNLQDITTTGLITAGAGLTIQTGQTFNLGTTGTTSPFNAFGLITGYNGITISGLTSTQAITASGVITASAGITVATGQTLSVGTSGSTAVLTVFGTMTSAGIIVTTGGTTTVQTITAAGLITGNNGLQISGSTTLQALTTTGLIQANLGLTIKSGQTLSIGTSGTTSPLQVYGQISGTNGISITAGLSNLQAITAAGLITGNAGLTIQGTTTTQALTATGLIQVTAGLTIQTGQTLNLGTTGTTSPFNAFGLITGYNGINITAGATTLQALTAAGLITASYGLSVQGTTATQALTSTGLIQATAGLTIQSGQTLNIGTTGTTSILNLYGVGNYYGTSLFTATGSNSAATSCVNISPQSTAATGSSNYYFTYFAKPVVSGSTSGSAYTVYIANAPYGTIANSYAMYIAAGTTYIGAGLQIPTGAAAGYVLTSDASGNTSWATPMFTDGTASAPSIAFVNNTNTGLYRIGSDNIGISTGGVKRIDISDTITQIITDFTTLAGYKRSVILLTAATLTLTTIHNMVEASSSSNVTITLPTVTGNIGREYTVIKTGSGSNTVTINTYSTTEYIDNGTSTSVILSNQYDRVTLVCGSTQWYTM